MRLVADEGVDRQIVEALRAAGFELVYFAEIRPGTSDEEILDECRRLQALLLTADKDFGELVFRRGIVHAGVVLLRLQGLAADRKSATVVNALATHGGRMTGAFSVISPGILRIRSSRDSE